MFRRRSKILEEEAKKDPDYRPTSELKAEGDDKPEYRFPWTILIIAGVLIVLMVICIILISIFKK